MLLLLFCIYEKDKNNKEDITRIIIQINKQQKQDYSNDKNQI